MLVHVIWLYCSCPGHLPSPPVGPSEKCWTSSSHPEATARPRDDDLPADDPKDHWHPLEQSSVAAVLLELHQPRDHRWERIQFVAAGGGSELRVWYLGTGLSPWKDRRR